MQIGILALALVFFLSGAKNLQNSGVFSKTPRESREFFLRRLGFGCMLIFVGILILIYYLAGVLPFSI